MIRDFERFQPYIYDVKSQLKDHVYARSLTAMAEGDRARDAVAGIAVLEERRTALREQFIAAIGGLPETDAPLNPRIMGVVECGGFTIENIVFESSPQTYVTSNLYIPNDIAAPRGAVVFVSGHHTDARLNEEYQMVCQYLVRAGLIVFAIDPVGQGERLSYYDPELQRAIVSGAVDDHEHAGAQNWPLGGSIARYFVRDIIRAIDYLHTRPEVDTTRIGITGNSGGGMQTSLAMICEPRIAAAAPATFIMSRASYLPAGQPQDAEQIWPGMTAAGFDHEDILLAIAPRPVLVLAAAFDFFPIEGTRRTVARVERFWDMYGCGDDLELYVEPCIHKYSEGMARKAASFFARHLLNAEVDSGQWDGSHIQPLPASTLWCTAQGQVRGDSRFPDARDIHAENGDLLQKLEAKRGQMADDLGLAWLRNKVITGRKPTELSPRIWPIGRTNELLVESALWWSQEGLFNHALLWKDSRIGQSRLPLTIALWERGTHQLQAHADWISRTCVQGRLVMVLDVSGEGALAPNGFIGDNVYDKFAAIHKLTTDLFWLDDSMAALRIFDVLRAVEFAGHIPGADSSDIRLYAAGKYSLHGRLAKWLDTDGKIRGLELSEDIKSVADWVRTRYYDEYDVIGHIVPGMLNYFDIADIDIWLGAT